MSEQSPLNAPTPNTTALIKDATTATFMKDVIEASIEAPVIVDFWAPNSAACAQLTPALEAAVTAANGAVRLVKINLEENRDLAAQFQVQSIPTVYAIKNGQPVDAFAGVMPEAEIKQFIKGLTGDNDKLNETLELAAEKLSQNDAQGAAELYAGILQQDPQHPEALGGLIKCYIEAGELETARETIDMLEDELQAHSAIASAATALDLAEKAGDTGNIEELKLALEADPADHTTRFELALANNARNRRDDAVEALISILQKDMQWNDGAARSQLLEFFEAWGAKDPATIAGRRKLASLLFA